MKVTNKNVIVRVKPEMTLEAMMVKLRLTYLGHVMRRESSMEQNIMLGKIEGRRKKGRPRTRWMDNVQEIIGMSVRQLKDSSKKREMWRRQVIEVTKSRTRLDGT